MYDDAKAKFQLVAVGFLFVIATCILLLVMLQSLDKEIGFREQVHLSRCHAGMIPQEFCKY